MRIDNYLYQGWLLKGIQYDNDEMDAYLEYEVRETSNAGLAQHDSGNLSWWTYEV